RLPRVRIAGYGRAIPLPRRRLADGLRAGSGKADLDGLGGVALVPEPLGGAGRRPAEPAPRHGPAPRSRTGGVLRRRPRSLAVVRAGAMGRGPGRDAEGSPNGPAPACGRPCGAAVR